MDDLRTTRHLLSEDMDPIYIQPTFNLLGGLYFTFAIITNRLVLSAKMKSYALVLLLVTFLWSLAKLTALILRNGFYADILTYIEALLNVVLMYLVVFFHLEILEAFATLSEWLNETRINWMKFIFGLLALSCLYPFFNLPEWFGDRIHPLSTVR